MHVYRPGCSEERAALFMRGSGSSSILHLLCLSLGILMLHVIVTPMDAHNVTY